MYHACIYIYIYIPCFFSRLSHPPPVCPNSFAPCGRRRVSCSVTLGCRSILAATRCGGRRSGRRWLVVIARFGGEGGITILGNSKGCHPGKMQVF